MSNKSLLSLMAALLVSTLAASTVLSADKPKSDPADPVEKKKESPKTEKPAAPPAGGDDKDKIEVVHPNDASAFKERMGKEVAVEGLVKAAAWSSSGKVMKVEFAEATDSKFMAVAFTKSRAALDAAFGGDVAKALSGKHVRVIGKVQDYKGAPEIAFEKPDQIEVLPDAPAADAGAKPADGTKPAEATKPAEQKKK